MKAAFLIVAVALAASSALAGDRRPVRSNSPCIAGDPVRPECSSSPLYNPPLISNDAMRQSPDTSGTRAFGQTRRPPQPQREGVPQR